MKGPFDRRKFMRVPLPYPVTLTTNDVKVVAKGARDVCAKGIFVDTHAEIEVGAECTIRIDLVPALDAPSIQAHGRIARVEEHGVAVEFTEIGLGSFEHLRNYIRLNSPDPERVDREFVEHLGLLSR